jgi:alpha-L-arabinofuranosidase
MSKSEANPKLEIPNRRPASFCLNLLLRISDLFRISIFGFRIWQAREESAMRTLLAGVLVLAWPAALQAQPAEAEIHVAADKKTGPVSRYLTGACIEDVNHEIYGALYSQMIFGESFQEPPSHRPVKGFQAFGGTWELRDDELHAGGGPGPTLVSDHAPLGRGAVGVEVFFADRAAGNAGLIVKTARVGVGADNFDGYEVSLNPERNVLTLGRHRHNWEHIKDVPCPVPVGEWVRLAVHFTEQTLEVLVNDRSVITYEDRQHPLRSGGVGLRQWQRAARYRKLWVKAGDHPEALPLQPNPDDLGPVSAMWRGFRRGTAAGKAALETERPFVGIQGQRLTFGQGQGAVGLENQGLNRWGLGLKAGKVYEGHLWARAEKPAELTVALESQGGTRSYARATLRVTDADWQKLPFTLTPDADDPAGRFAVTLAAPGSVVLGYVFLQPGEWGRFKGLPVRRDVAEGLRDMGVTVLRYGGSMVNAPEYRWKKMIGPRDRRPPYRGFWYPQSSNGWGIIDFLDLCEAAGFLAIPAFNLDETPKDMADFVAYVNGPADSPWGKKRAADGHPAPYRLRHLEVGNEERVDDKYFARFRAIAEAVWAVDPEIILVVGDFVYSQPITDPDAVKGAASGITSLAAHRQVLELARRHDREVWFDIHVDTDDPGRLGEVAVVPIYVEALAKLSGGARHRVAVFELNAGNHAQRRALANALAIGALQQLGDRLAVVCSANGLQPDGQNDNGWDQGLLFLNPTGVWLQPPGYVTRMIARHYQPLNLPAEIRGAAGAGRVAAARSEDGQTLVLRVVNPGDQPLAARVRLDGFGPLEPTAAVEELAGPAGAVNTATEPDRWVPRRFEWRHEMVGAGAAYAFPPRSFTVLTFRRVPPKGNAPSK